MSKTAKALIVAACLILLGAVIGGIGFFYGGWDTLTENYGPDAVENSQSWSEPAQKLEISTVSDNVLLRPSEDGKVRVDWKDTRYGYYEVSLERDTLEITYRDTEQKPHFNFGEEEPRTVAVYLPESSYESLLLTTVSGHAASSGFSFDRTEITATSGQVGLGNGSFGEAKINTTSGDVVLDGYDATTTEITTTSGDVIGTVAAPKLFYAESVSGTAEYPVNDYSTGNFTVHTISGDVKLSYDFE